jgi:hypothetical protein
MPQWSHKIEIKAIDKFYYDGKVTYNINTSWDSWQTAPEVSSWANTWEQQAPVIEVPAEPVIIMTNPINGDNTLSLYSDQNANIRWTVSNASEVTAINVYLNGKLYKILDGWTSFVFAMNDTKDFDVWTYSIKIEALNSDGKSAIKILEMKILPR